MRDIAFRKQLASVVTDNKYDRYVKNRKSGKLHGSSLYKVETSSRVFKRREARLNKHYSFTILVDVSGSMRNRDKISIAAKSVDKISFHLDAIGLPHNIVMFNHGVTEVKTFEGGYDKKNAATIQDEVMSNNRSRYIYDGNHYVERTDGKRSYLKFLERTTRKQYFDNGCGSYYEKKYSTDRIIDMDGPDENNDGEAVRVAREYLLKRAGQKVMIVLSDGRPTPKSHLESPTHPGFAPSDFSLQREIEITLQSRVEVYSIGILDTGVERYYPKRRTRVIQDLTELYPSMIGLIKSNLKRG